MRRRNHISATCQLCRPLRYVTYRKYQWYTVGLAFLAVPAIMGCPARLQRAILLLCSTKRRILPVLAHGPLDRAIMRRSILFVPYVRILLFLCKLAEGIGQAPDPDHQGIDQVCAGLPGKVGPQQRKDALPILLC